MHYFPLETNIMRESQGTLKDKSKHTHTHWVPQSNLPAQYLLLINSVGVICYINSDLNVLNDLINLLIRTAGAGRVNMMDIVVLERVSCFSVI